MSRKKIILITLLIISFIITLLTYLFKDEKYSRITFKFYHEFKHHVILEDRYVILDGNREENAQLIVDELFLGPISVFNHKLLPMDMKYNLFYIKGKTAYLDLPLKFISSFDEDFYTIDEAVELIKENIIRNISGINFVNLTIEGETMGSGPSQLSLPQGE